MSRLHHTMITRLHHWIGELLHLAMVISLLWQISQVSLLLTIIANKAILIKILRKEEDIAFLIMPNKLWSTKIKLEEFLGLANITINLIEKISRGLAIVSEGSSMTLLIDIKMYRIQFMKPLGPGQYSTIGDINNQGKYFVDKYHSSGASKIGNAKRFDPFDSISPGPGKCMSFDICRWRYQGDRLQQLRNLLLFYIQNE